MPTGNTVADVHQILEELTTGTARCSIERRIQLCEQCLENVAESATEWSELAAVGKGLSKDSVWRAEDLLSGPSVVARQLQLTRQTLQAIQTQGRPSLPARPVRLANEQLAVPVFPATGLFDSLTFMGIHANVRMQPGVTVKDLHGQLPQIAENDDLSKITAVLGAGNVSSIPVTDSLNRIMFEGSRVFLKLNPVNEYLSPVFDRAFAPLIEAGLLRIVKGGAEVGEAMIAHPSVHAVHITGATTTHDAIVWGRDPAEQQRRRQANEPLLKKQVTSELGNVTPWIIVPGEYSMRQLQSQAQHIAASITNNASFNCLATKMIITWKRWPQRDTFLQLVQHHLAQTPMRPAYYPGAVQRFQRFSGTEIQPDEFGCLPWTLLLNQRIQDRPELFTEESFVCVCAETSLDCDTPVGFLSKATEFVNHQMTGTLCATVTVPTAFRQQHQNVFRECLSKLRYGSVCVNQWSGIAYGLTSPPWGAYPGATLQNIQSGLGNVHNTFLLDQIEKTVLEGPLVNFPKPVWFPSHRNSVQVATRLVQLYHRPNLINLTRLFASAIMG
jgi:hypothetical protein